MVRICGNAPDLSLKWLLERTLEVVGKCNARGTEDLLFIRLLHLAADQAHTRKTDGEGLASLVRVAAEIVGQAGGDRY